MPRLPFRYCMNSSVIPTESSGKTKEIFKFQESAPSPSTADKVQLYCCPICAYGSQTEVIFGGAAHGTWIMLKLLSDLSLTDGASVELTRTRTVSE